MERRLAAILAADVVGFSRLISADETPTLTRLRTLRTDTIDPLMAEHGGRIFKTTGDGLLAEFPSAVQALRCAIAIQTRQSKTRDPLYLRIGLHQGDVVVEGEDLLGDGINIAARIEPLAEPGGIAMSARVHEDADGKIPLELEDLGTPALKNIARPVQVFRLRIGTPPPPTLIQSLRPTLAVLPFRGAAEDEPFADGLTEELINALAAWRSFPVIARNSAFAYRDRTLDVRVIGRDLGARYIVTGAVRRSGGTLRVSVSLADVETAETLLGENFARADSATLELQDEIVRALAGILAPEVQKLERDRAARRPASEAGAYDLFIRGMWHRYRDTRESLAEAETWFRAALAVEPGYCRAITHLSLCSNFAAISKWVPDVAEAHAESLALARRAVAADPRDPHAHFALGVALLNHAMRPEASVALRAAIRLNPSHAFAHANLGQLSNFDNRPDDGLASVELALRLNPHDPRRFMWLPYLAASRYLRRDYLACLQACTEALQANPGYPHALRYMTAALGMLHRPAEARPLLSMLRRVDGDFAALETMTRHYFVPEAAEHLLEGFRRAGVT